MAHDLIFGKTRRDWSCGLDDPLVWTPGAARAELRRIRDLVDTVNQEVSGAASAGRVLPAEYESWRRTYLTAHEAMVSASPYWGSNVVAARRHEAEALRWRDLVRKRGGALVAPPDLGQPPHTDGLGFNTQTAVLAVGGVAALALLVRAVRK